MKSSEFSMKLTPCNLSWDLLTYLKIRALPSIFPTPSVRIQLNIVNMNTAPTNQIPNPKLATRQYVMPNSLRCEKDIDDLSAIFLADEWLNEEHQKLVHATIRSFVSHLFFKRFSSSLSAEFKTNASSSPSTSLSSKDLIPEVAELCRSYRVAEKRLLLSLLQHYS